MLGATAEGSPRVKLNVEKPDAALDAPPALLEELLGSGRVLELPVGAALGHDRDALGFELLPHGLPGPISVVSEELALKGGFQERIKPLAVVALAGDLLQEGEASLRCENQVLPHPMKIALEGSTVAGPGQATQAAVFLTGTDGPADVYRVGVDNEKGGAPSPASSQKAPQSRCMRGARSALRSAKLGLESRRGNSFWMIRLVESHWW